MIMDEYNILKKKKKNGFTTTSLLVFLSVLILGVAGFVLLTGSKDTKSNGSCEGSNCSCKTQVFYDNLDIIKEAAISYFTNERLPKKVSDEVKLTLNEMQKEKLVLGILDDEGILCDGDKTYVSITKLENEYLLKINLSCNNMEDYILVHLGCYDYCKNTVCEKQETYEYEYRKTTACKMSNWSNWSNWQLEKENTSNNKKEDTKEETVLNTVIDKEKPSITNGFYTCPDGYTLSGTVCEKEVNNKEVKNANIVYQDVCPEGYTLNNNKCEKKIENIKTSQPIITETTYQCPNGYTLSGTVCTKTNIVKETKELIPQLAYKQESYTCYKKKCSTTTVFSCDTGSCEMIPQTTCDYVKKTCNREVSYISGYTCPDGYLNNGKECYKNVSVTDTKDRIEIKGTTTCKDGYNLVNNQCEKKETNMDIKEPSKEVKEYTCPDGYTLNNDNKCTKEVTNKITVNATYNEGTTTCKEGYTLENGSCNKKITAETKVTYYRYATRSCIGGSSSTKWSIENDTDLLNQGYKLTGNKRVLK